MRDSPMVDELNPRDFDSRNEYLLAKCKTFMTDREMDKFKMSLSG